MRNNIENQRKNSKKSMIIHSIVVLLLIGMLSILVSKWLTNMERILTPEIETTIIGKEVLGNRVYFRLQDNCMNEIILRVPYETFSILDINDTLLVSQYQYKRKNLKRCEK